MMDAFTASKFMLVRLRCAGSVTGSATWQLQDAELFFFQTMSDIRALEWCCLLLM
jgi:hypothetical protein